MEEIPPPPANKKGRGRKSKPIQNAPTVPVFEQPPPESLPQEEILTKLLADRAAEQQALDRHQFGPDYVPASQAVEIRQVVAELASRRCEALKLYEPLPEQARFHASPTKTRLLRGSNRGGKTFPAAVEVARAVTGQDPHGKYPARDGLVLCVGKNFDHIGIIMWPKLGKAGSFKMIRDLTTGEWRSFRPFDPLDLMREDEAKPAPPLIPPRLILEIGWENKKENMPKVVRLRTGWEIWFFSSEGKPQQGSAVDLVWLDEEIADPDWPPEMAMRVADRRGRIVWSATPQAGTDALYDLHERAEKQAGTIKPTVEEFRIRLSENPHIDEGEKKEMAEGLTEEQRAVRIDGEFAQLGYLVYPTFSFHTHGVEPFEIPLDWTRYMVVDPGYQVCAVLFAVVPPPTLPPPLGGDYVYLFDELYLRGCDSSMFAAAVARKVQGQQFQAFLIDSHMAIHSELGTGRTVSMQYSLALREQDVASVTTGHDFLLASDDKKAGVLSVIDWLKVRPDGTTKLRAFRGRLPNFKQEIERYHRKRLPTGEVLDETNDRRRNHLMDDLRYLAMYNPQWVKPRPQKPRLGAAVQAFRAKQQKSQDKSGGRFVNLGPGGRLR